MFRKQVLVIPILAALAVLGVTIPAHAVGGLIDVCESSAGNGHCWRMSTATDEWPRDISGDRLQQLRSKNFLGTISSHGCPAASGILSGSTSVFSFTDPNGFLIGAGFHSGSRYYVGEDTARNGGWTDDWWWSSTGSIGNCGDSGGLFELCHVADFSQLYTQQGCTATWSTVDPPA